MAAVNRIKAILKADDQASPTFSKVTKAVKILGVAAAGVGAVQIGRVLARGFADAINTSKTFEQSMSRVSALAGVTGGNLKKLSDQSKELGRTTVFTASQSADAMAEFAKAGFDAAQISGAIGPALDLAAAGQLELAQAAGITASVMASMGKTTDELGNVVDVLAKGAISAKTDVAELGEGFKFAGAAAAATGVEFEDLIATFSALATAGIPVEQTAAQMRNLFLEIKKNTEGNITTFGKFKVQLFDSQGAFVGMSEALRRFEAAGISADNVAGLFEKRLAGVMLAAFAQRDSIEELEGSLRNADGTAKRVADTFLANLGGSITRLFSATEGLKTEIGEKFQEALVVLVDEGLTPVVSKMAEFVKESDNMRTAVITLLRDVAEIAEPFEEFARSKELARGLSLALLAIKGAAAETTPTAERLGDRVKETGEGFLDSAPFIRDWAVALEATGLVTRNNSRFVERFGDVLAFIDPRFAAVSAGAEGMSESLKQVTEDGLVTTTMVDRLNKLLAKKPEAADKAADGVKDVADSALALSGQLVPVISLGRQTIDVLHKMADAANEAGEAFGGEVGFDIPMPEAPDMEARISTELEAQDRLLQLRIRAAEEWSIQQEELEIERIENYYMREIESAEKLGADTVDIRKAAELEITETQKKFSEKRAEIAKKEAMTRRQLNDLVMGHLDATLREAFGSNKAVSIALAIMHTWAGAARALQDYPWPYSHIIAALVAAQGLAQVAKIRSTNIQGFQEGGVVRGPRLGRDTIPIIVDGGERIFSARDNRDLIDAIERLPTFIGGSFVGPDSAAQTERRELIEALAEPAEINVEVNVEGSINRAIDDINVMVRSGNTRLFASEIVSARSTR